MNLQNHYKPQTYCPLVCPFYCQFCGQLKGLITFSNPHPPKLSLFWQSKKILTTPTAHGHLGWSGLRDVMVGVGE